MYCSIHNTMGQSLRLSGGEYTPDNANVVNITFQSGNQRENITVFGLDEITAEALSLLASASLGERNLILGFMRSIRAQVRSAATSGGI